MGREVVSRMMAVLMAVLVAMSTSSLAVAHGSAHQTASADAHGAGLPITHGSPDVLAVETAEHDAHAHPKIGAAVTSRSTVAKVVLAPSPVIPGAVSANIANPTFDEVLAVPIGPPPLRSQQPRAPPLG